MKKADNGLFLPEASHYKKATPPRLGEAYGTWAGREQLVAMQLPGGAMLQFDLSKLTLADYRTMRSHYQVNISLNALTFLMHQLEWHVECKDKKIAAAAEDNMREVWTQLARATSQAYWAGYSPTVIDWVNNDRTSKIEVKRFRDLVPEESRVNWKKIEGYAPPGHPRPTLLNYDGIKQFGTTWPIPAENTFWYPLMMENGDYYGRKVLKSAFPAWFFSQLIHLFANRYFERFGEPLPVGRAPFDDEVRMSDGKSVNGRVAMETILAGIRNRSSVVLPNDINLEAQQQSTGKANYEYEIEYLESQMRGADFERYLTRLDEEISLALFTPLLMTRTADVGSYNLGVAHTQMYLWMFNALAGDQKEYIDHYILDRFVDFNYGVKAPRARWIPEKGGKRDAETTRAIITALISQGSVGVDLIELGTSLGLTLKEIEQVTAPPAAPGGDPAKKVDPRAGRVKDAPKVSKGIGKSVSSRVAGQIKKAFRDGTFDRHFSSDFGYRRQFEEALVDAGWDAAEASRSAEQVYGRVGAWLDDVAAAGPAIFSSPDQVTEMFERVLDGEIEAAAVTRPAPAPAAPAPPGPTPDTLALVGAMDAERRDRATHAAVEARRQGEHFGSLAAALTAMANRPQEASVVNVAPPSVNVEAPQINVESPAVNVTVPAGETITVPAAHAKTRRIERDEKGNITRIIEEE